MTWRLLLPADVEGGVTHYSRPDGEGGLQIASQQDVAVHLERNKALKNHDDGYSEDRTWRRAASIPDIIVQKWRDEEGIDLFNPDHGEAVKRKLNSSDYAYLRTAEGQL